MYYPKFRRSVHSGLIFPETKLYISSFQDQSKYQALGEALGDVKDWSDNQNFNFSAGVDQAVMFEDSNKYYKFDGVNDYLQDPNNTIGIGDNDDFTVALWFKGDSASRGTTEALFDNNSDVSTVNGMSCFLYNDNNRIYFRISNGVINIGGFRPVGDIRLTPVFHFLVCGRSANTIYISFDNDTPTVEDTGASGVNVDGNHPFTIFAQYDDSFQMKGELAEFWVFNKWLTTAERTFIYENSFYNRLQ